MSKKYVYLFSEGNGAMRELLGGKGANLAEMTNLGMPVPQGFTITTEACTRYYDDGRTLAEEIQTEILAALKKLEEINSLNSLYVLGYLYAEPDKDMFISAAKVRARSE